MIQEPIYDIDGALFDMGSTLLEYETIPWSVLDVNCMDAAYSFLEKAGYKLPTADIFWKKHVEIWQKYRNRAAESLEEWSIIDGITDLLASLDISTDGDMSDRFFDAYYTPVSRQLTVYADAHATLEKIKSKGKKIGLVSNTYFPENYHLGELKRFGLLPLFDFTIFSVSFGYRKPHRSIYTEAARRLDLEPDRILFVGDRYVEDCLGPKESGMNAILKYREGRDYPDPMDDNQVVVESLTELLNYIAD